MMTLRFLISIIVFVVLGLAQDTFGQSQVQPPKPFGPVPTPAQLRWIENDLSLYLRLGMNTFTGLEDGTGKESPATFDPQSLDVEQWVNLAKDCGFPRLVLSAKSNDGFCLWPTKTSNHSVQKSPWQKGRGDVVKQFTQACAKANVDAGLFVSVEDRNHSAYGSPAYNNEYINQLNEVLSSYGPISELRFDGAGGEGAGAVPISKDKDPRADYDWKAFFATAASLQPNMIMVSNVGPHARWNGNNSGHAGIPNWSRFEPDSMPGPILTHRKQLGFLNFGWPQGTIFCPAECFVRIRPGWYYHQKEDTSLMPLDRLVTTYIKSVGRNCVLMLNVPIDNRGLIPDAEVKLLKAFHESLTKIFQTNFAAGKKVKASNVRGGSAMFDPDMALDNDINTYWATDDTVTRASMEVDLGQEQEFNLIKIEEMISLGQRILEYEVDAWDNASGSWKQVVKGTSVGRRKLEPVKNVKTSKVRFTIAKALACPVIRSFGLYLR